MNDFDSELIDYSDSTELKHLQSQLILDWQSRGYLTANYREITTESAKIELRQKLAAKCDARSLLEATLIESDDFPVSFVVITLAVGISALLGPCVSIMLRHLFARLYPL